MDFDTMQRFASSWGLAYMVVIFVGVVLFLARPRAKQSAIEAATIPFREDDHQDDWQ